MMRTRLALGLLGTAAALVAQDVDRPPLDLPRAATWFDDPANAAAPTALVVVRRGHAPWVRTVGHVDADGTAAIRPDSWVPLGAVSQLLLREAVRLERDTHGLDPDESLADTAAAAVAGLDGTLGAVSWARLLESGETPAPRYHRPLPAGVEPRPLADVLAAHAFRDPRRRWHSGDTWAALVQRGLEVRRAAGWDAIVTGRIAASLGGAAFAARRPDGVPVWAGQRGDSEWTWRDREVAAAGAAWLRLDTAPALLDVLLARSADDLCDEALGGFREDSDRPPFVAAEDEDADFGPVYSSIGSYDEPDVELRVYGPEQGIAILLVTGAGYAVRDELMARVVTDLFHSELPEGEVWNSAVGMYGGRGGRWNSAIRLPQLDPDLVGTWSAEVGLLDGSRRVDLHVRDRDPRAIDCEIDGRDVRETSSGEDRRCYVTPSLRDGGGLHFDLELAGSALVGYVDERPDTSTHLPWPVRFAAAGPAESEVASIPELVEELDLAERLAHADGAVPTARVLALWTELDGPWVTVAGRPDPDADEALTADRPLPFGVLSRAVTWRVLEDLDAAGDIDLDAPFTTAWRGGDVILGDRGPRSLRSLLDGSGLPIYYRHVDDATARRPLEAALATHGFAWPEWIAADPESEYGFGLVQAALERGPEPLDFAAAIAAQDGLRLLAGPDPVRDGFRLVGPDGSRAPRFGEVSIAWDAWGTPAAALQLGADVLRSMDGGESLPFGARSLPDVGSRGIDALGWHDDRPDVTRRLVVWPSLGLVMFAFDAGGATGWIDDATDGILDRFEPGVEFIQYYDAPMPGEGHKGVSRYRGELDAGGETLAIELVNDWPQPKLNVDGTSLDFELRRYVGYDIVLSAPLGDGRELWLAVRHNFFATALGGVGWIVEPGAAMLPYELLLIRQRN